MTASNAGRLLLTVFVTALTLRWAYTAILFAGFGESSLLGADSHGYLAIARGFAEKAASGALAGWGWLGPDLSLMPLFTWWIAVHAALAGGWAAPAFVATQSVIDAGTCVLVAMMAARLVPAWRGWAGLAAAGTPTLIVLSGLVYTDTLFVFFATAALYAALRWLENPGWRWALLMGVAVGLAAWTRVLIVPWMGVLAVLLAAILLLGRRLRWRHLGQIACAGAMLGLLLAPILARNLSLHDAWALTPQSGNHLANWVLPLVREGVDGTPREKTKAAVEAALIAQYGPMSANPFVNSRRYTALAREEMAKLGLGAVARAWIFGAAINLVSPAVVHVPPVSALPRTGFYDTPGDDFTAKLFNFLFRSESALYTWLLLAGLAGVAAFRLLQLVGLVALLRRGENRGGLVILAGWCLYILAINGPIASPKYRLPLEPPLAVLTGAGLAAWAERRRRKRAA